MWNQINDCPSYTDQERVRWHDIFRVLSLDCVLPLWERMGVVLPEDQKIFAQHAARLAYLVYQDGASNHYEANFSKTPQAITLFDGNLETYHHDLRQTVMDWCREGYKDDQDCLVELEWYSVLTRLIQKDAPLTYQLELSDEKRSELVHLVREELTLTAQDIGRLLDQASDTQKTAWDEWIYHGSMTPSWEPWRPKKELFDALIQAFTNVQYRSFINFWRKMIQQFSDDGLEVVYQWYLGVIGEKGQYIPQLKSMPTMQVEP